MIIKSPILITGAARSGTSMVAGCVNRCGAWGGDMAGPTPSNRRGMYENTAIRNELVKPYLKEIGCDPMGQDPLPRISDIIPVPDLLAANWRKAVIDIITAQGYIKGPWFYKGAKMCLIWPVWRAAFPDAKWIIVRRDPEGIVQSCIKAPFMRAFKHWSGWLSWVAKHQKRFEEMLDARLDIREVWPQRMINGDYNELQATINHVGLSWKFDEVLKFIEPSLWHRKKEENKNGK